MTQQLQWPDAAVTERSAAVMTQNHRDMMLQLWLDAAAMQIAGCHACVTILQMQLNRMHSMK